MEVHDMENENGTETPALAMEVQDMEDVQQSSLKRPLTPPTSGDGEPPLKRSLSDEEVKGQTTYIDEVDGGDGDGGDAGEAEAEDPSSTTAGTNAIDDDLLPTSMPKVYDLFATCVS